MLYMLSMVKTFVRTILGTVIVTAVFGQEFLLAGVANYGFASTFPIPVTYASAMVRSVFRSVDKYEVLLPVISFISVDVMDKFMGFKRPSEVFTHNQPMLGDISDVASSERIGMIGSKNVDIPINGGKPTSPPSGVPRTSLPMAHHKARPLVFGHSVESSPTRVDILSTAALTFHDVLLPNGLIAHLRPLSQGRI